MPEEPDDEILDPTNVFKPLIPFHVWEGVEITPQLDLVSTPFDEFKLAAWQKRVIRNWFGEDADNVLEFLDRFGGPE